MLNKELLMVGGTEDLWTLQFQFTGDSHLYMELYSNEDIVWYGYPSTFPNPEKVQVPPKSTLTLSLAVSAAYDILKEDGCLVESLDMRTLQITVFQSTAYLDVTFTS